MGCSLDSKYLELMVAIAEEGSMARARWRLDLTPSVFGHPLAILGARLAEVMSRRQNRACALTSLGQWASLAEGA